jgi:hypothetical protein
MSQNENAVAVVWLPTVSVFPFCGRSVTVGYSRLKSPTDAPPRGDPAAGADSKPR